MEIPKISVCISTRNRDHYLETSIKSALNQTLGNIEIIVLDDCSTDNTFEVVKQFEDPRILYVRTQKRLGVTPSWNQCVSVSRGKYITFLNDDDALLPEMLEEESRLLDENPDVACVYSGFNLIDSDGGIIQTNIPHKESYIKNGEEEFLTHIISNYICTQTALIRKDIFNQIGGFDDSLCLCTDLDFFFRLELGCHKIGYINKSLVYSRSHEESLTCRSIMDKSILREYLEVLRKTLGSENIKELYTLDEVTLLIRNAMTGIVRHLFRWSYECLKRGDLKSAAYYLRQLTPWRNADFGTLGPSVGMVMHHFMQTGRQALKSYRLYFTKTSG